MRPILEYSCTVWDPFTQANITKLEKIQRHFARFILNDYRWTSSVTAMIHQLQWQTLQERRAHLKVAMMYRIINSYIDIPGSYLVQATQTNRGHSMKLLVPNARTLHVTYQNPSSQIPSGCGICYHRKLSAAPLLTYLNSRCRSSNFVREARTFLAAHSDIVENFLQHTLYIFAPCLPTQSTIIHLWWTVLHNKKKKSILIESINTNRI